MGVFNYANPRSIHWGAGSVSQLRAEVERVEAPRIALVTTRSLLGHADRLPIDPVATVTIAQHAPMAQIRTAAEDIGLAGVRGIVSFGGGSAIDAAKIIAVRLAGADGRALPHIAIPTTLSVAELAAGGAGYTNDSGDKAGMRDPRLLVETVIYDAELTLVTPMQLWLSTGIRALDHAVEGFLAPGDHPLNDVLALAAIRRLFDSLPRAKSSPEDLGVRTENQLAAWFSFTLPGASAGGLSHTMGKQIGARHGIPHGVTSCLLLPHALRYQARLMPDRAAQLPDPDDVSRLIASLGLPQHIREFGVDERALKRASEELAGTYPAADLFSIYEAAM